MRSERETLGQQIEAANQRVARIEEQLETERTRLADKQARQTEIESKRNQTNKRETEAAEKLTELRLGLATEQQRYDNLMAQRHPMTARELELAETIAARRAEVADFEKRLGTQAEESKEAEGAIGKQTSQRAELESVPCCAHRTPVETIIGDD